MALFPLVHLHGISDCVSVCLQCAFGSNPPNWYQNNRAYIQFQNTAQYGLAVADSFVCGISLDAPTGSLRCFGANTAIPDARTCMTAQGFTLTAPQTDNMQAATTAASFVPGGAAQTVVFAKVTAGAETACGIFTASGSASVNRVACWGPVTAAATLGHAILNGAFAGTNGNAISANVNVAIGSAVDVCVSAFFACAVGATGSPRSIICWGALGSNAPAADAVWAANATGLVFTRVVCTPASVCGVTSDK